MRYLIHSIDFHWLPFEIDGVGSVIIMVTLRRMAVELLSLFSPLYIFNLTQNLNFSFQHSLLAVVSFILMIYLAKLLTMPLAENSSFRFGYRRTLILSTLPFFLFVGFLFFSQIQPVLIILAAIFWGIHAAFFWFGFHGLFVKRADQNHFGKQTGICQTLYILVGIATPVLGGLIVLKLGYQFLFLVAGTIFSLAMMVALLSKEVKPRRDARLTSVLRLLKTHKKIVAAYFGWGAEAALYGALWPVYLFLLVGGVLFFGEIVSAAVLVAAVITYLIGLIVDKIGMKDVLSLGAIIGFLTWIVRTVIKAPLAIVSVDGFYRVSEQMIHIPLSVLSYQKAIDGGIGQALYFREISLCLGAITALVLAAVIILISLPLKTIFLLASLGVLAPILIVKK